MTSNSDHNLLFGIIALQMDFVQREQLVAATSAWLINKSQRIDEILVEQGALSEEDRQLLSPLVARHLENHGGDPQKSLAAMSSIGSVADELRSLGDDGIEATLSIVGSNLRELHAETVLHDSVGSSTASPVRRDTTDTRFRVLRSHAKGGLGEVYVAKDTELNREVALKEIQTKYADDENSRLRFLLEAEVTGGLEHPGIVPVYGLGRYEDGRPFYAMRFIKGDSLQEAADRFHGRNSGSGTDTGTGDFGSTNRPDFNSLEFRKLLGRFIDVCQAIEYAHSRGVLHRDLKPGNIMLGKYGETLVVDWGLAKAQGRDESDKVEGEPTLRPASASGSAPTMMGSAIGTPAFMPPEQAAGNLPQLGPASDVYSLGATLYYLLTGKPPFQVKDLTALLESVKAGEFPAPDAVQRSVPKALASICLKAMSLSSHDRYATPAKIAEEIERYLADEPVEAFPEPLLVRARRWVRKHQTLTTATGAVVLVSAVGLGVFSTIVSGKNRELTESNRRESEARELAEANEATARQQSQLALATLTSVIHDLQTGLQNLSGGGEIRRRLLQTSLANLDNVATRYVQESAIDRQTMIALWGLGELVLGFGADGIQITDPSAEHRDLSKEQASAVKLVETLYRRAHEIALELASANPQDTQAQHDVFVCYNRLGSVQLRLGDSAAALDSYQKSFQISERLAAAHPQDAAAQRDLSTSLSMLGYMQHQLGDSESAVASYEKSVEISEKLAENEPQNAIAQLELSLGYLSLGTVHIQSGNSAAALTSYGKSRKVTEMLVDDEPQNVQAQRQLSASYVRLGLLQLQSLGNPTAALNSYQKSRSINQKLVANDPKDIQSQRELSVSHERIGDVQYELGNFKAALASYQDSHSIREDLAKADPQDTPAQRALAVSWISLGQMQHQLRDPAAGLESYQKSLQIYQKLVAADPQNVETRRELAGAYSRVAFVQLSLGQSAEGLVTTKRSVEILEELAANDPHHAHTLDSLATAYKSLAGAYRRSGQFDEAVVWNRKSIEILETLAMDDPQNARFQHGLALAHYMTAATYQRSESWDAAVAEFSKASNVLATMIENDQLVKSAKFLQSDIDRRVAQMQLLRVATGDLEQLLDQPAEAVPELLELRGKWLTQQSRFDEAAQTAAKLRELDNATTTQLYNAACTYALCAASIKAAEGEELSAVRIEQRRTWTDDAIATLKQAISAGWDDFDKVQQDEDLAIIRDHPEFQKLIPKSD